MLVLQSVYCDEKLTKAFPPFTQSWKNRWFVLLNEELSYYAKEKVSICFCIMNNICGSPG